MELCTKFASHKNNSLLIIKSINNYIYPETTYGGGFRNRKLNELRPSATMIYTASNWTEMKNG